MRLPLDDNFVPCGGWISDGNLPSIGSSRRQRRSAEGTARAIEGGYEDGGNILQISQYDAPTDRLDHKRRAALLDYLAVRAVPLLAGVLDTCTSDE
jgi:hypothetical protein